MTGCWLRCWSGPGTRPGAAADRVKAACWASWSKRCWSGRWKRSWPRGMPRPAIIPAIRGMARSAKKVQTGIGPVPIDVPRDRAGNFEPVLVPKRSGRVSGGLDDMIISLYAHGMSVRGILHRLRQVYGTELSAETVSRITDEHCRESGQTHPCLGRGQDWSV
jgi:Transposase, Mutator family